MKTSAYFITKACLCIGLTATHLCSFAQMQRPLAMKERPPASLEQKEQRELWAQERAAHFEKFLVSMANRLEIKSSQQAQWDSFSKALRAFKMQQPWGFAVKEPSQTAPTDAASLAKAMADKMTEGAAKMAVLANETAELQKILTPEQQKTFNQIAWQWMHPHPMHKMDQLPWNHDGANSPEHPGPAVQPPRPW